MRYNHPQTPITNPEVSMLRPARVLILVCLMTATLTSLALARSPEVQLQTADQTGVQFQVDIPAGETGWNGLVAIPVGRDAGVSGLPAGASLGDAAIMHGVKVAPLTIPSDPARRLRADVALDFTATAAATARTERTVLAASFARLLESQTVNGAEVRGQYDETPGTYLMICASAAGVTEAVAPLAAWRRQQGYNVQVVTTVTTGGTTSAIKNYIQGVYDTAEQPLAYIVLVGDATGTVSVPTWHETVSGYYGEGDHE